TERFDIQIRNHIKLFSSAAETGKIAAQRQPSTIIDVHAHTRQRRTRWARLVDVVVTNIDPDIHLEDARENGDLLFRYTLFVEIQRRIVCHSIRSRHHVYEVQRGGSHPRRKDRDLLQLVHQIAPDHDLDPERQLRHVTTSERAHQT